MKPFNLEAAKRGEPLVTRDGRKATYVGYVEGINYPLVVHIDGNADVNVASKEGRAFHALGDSLNDLFMAPKKRTVWVNLYGGTAIAGHYPNEHIANCQAASNRVGGRAWPLEIEE